jgi:ketosteroid isomerase-like protein
MRDGLRLGLVCAAVVGVGVSRVGADVVKEATQAEEAFWAARTAGDLTQVQALLAPGYVSVESDCNGLRVSEGAGAAISRLKQELAEGSYGSYKLLSVRGQMAGQAVILTVGWKLRYTPRVGGARAVRYTAGTATVVWAKDEKGAWKRFHYHSHWRPIHTHAFGKAPEP